MGKRKMKKMIDPNLVKTPLEKILMVNDDSEDILAMKARLPDNIQVLGTSQFQAQYLKSYDFGLIIVDNDANNMNASKGVETLARIREKNPNVPVMYTSFQPAMVPMDVYGSQNTLVVSTNAAMDVLSKMFNVPLKEKPKLLKAEPRTSIIMTYNDVEGYKPGVYGDGKLLIVSYDKKANEKAKDVLMKNLEKLYKGFDFRKDRDVIKNIFVYDGLSAGEYPCFAAAVLGHDLRMVVNMMACGCNWGAKKRYSQSIYTKLYEVRCGGDRELGIIADIILGVDRVNKNNLKDLSISVEEILSEAKRFEM